MLGNADLANAAVSKSLTLGSYDFLSPTQNLISYTMVQKLCLKKEYIMSYLDSKMGYARTPSNHQTLKELAA